MRIICKKTALIKALGIVSRGLPAVSTIGIVKGILIKTIGDLNISLSTTDIQLAITTISPAIVNEEGSIVVDARLFSDLIRKLPEEDITLTTDEKNLLSIKTQTTDNEIQGLLEEDFPRIENIAAGKRINFERETLREMIEGTTFAASVDESRGVLTGTLFELGSGKLSLVALDGYRVAIRRDISDKLQGEEATAVIPARMLKEAGKILSETDEDAAGIEFSENKAVLYTGDTTIRMNLLNGDFIKYEDVLPKETLITVKTRREELLNAVELAEVYKSDGKNSVLKFSISGNELVVSSRAELGRGKETIAIEKEGDDLEIAFDSRFLKDALRAIDEEKIVLGFTTSVGACTITPESGERFTYLILPVRLSSAV